jgi:hypothetical protein
MPTAGLTRRHALLGLAIGTPALLVAACGSSSDSPATVTPTDSSSAPAAPDEAGLIALYDVAIAAFPDLAADLEPIRAQHVAHADALGESVDGGSATAQATPGAMVTALVQAERAASRRRIAACVDEADAERARLLAFVAASEAAHAPALRRVGAR